MNIWGSKQLRRLALPLAVVSLGAALTMGWGQSFASGAAPGAASPDQNDPEVAVQSVDFVLVPRDNDNFRPENVCGGGPNVDTTVTPPVEKANAFGTGLGLLQKLSMGPSRCTLAVFKPTIHQGKDLLYSSTPCATTTSPATAPNTNLKFVGLHTPDKLHECTAPIFLSTLDGKSKTTPDLRNNSIPASQSAAGRVAIHDWAGTSCKPGPCTLFAEMVNQEGDFNAPGLCTSAFYITGPCIAATLTTSDVNGPLFVPTCTGTTNATCTNTLPAAPLVPATPNSGVPTFTPGGKTLNFTDGSCPPSTSLSNRGDIQQGCTNLPFKPADMSFTFPPIVTPPNEVTFPCQFPFVPGDACGKAKHSVEIATQSLTLELSPKGQDTFDPPNACSIPGDTLSSLVVTRCTAAHIVLPITFAGGDVSIPTSRCTFDLSNSKGHGNNQGGSCFAQPFSPSKGNTIIHNLPAVFCRADVPALPVAGVTPQVACVIDVVLTHQDGDFNAEQPCGNIGNGSVNATCLLASFNTDGHQQGDTLTANAATPVCPAGNGGKAVIDADVTDTCVSADSTIAAPFTAGSLKADLVAGTPFTTFSVTIPEDRIV
ncbi:MAG TPA: hypothetical protein VMO88_02125 [Acidimicrobiales bacterium]|nr:hypothetical protein [Acidimicrobiales bacterium]